MVSWSQTKAALCASGTLNNVETMEGRRCRASRAEGPVASSLVRISMASQVRYHRRQKSLGGPCQSWKMCS